MTTITIPRALLEQALEALELVTDLTNHDDEIYEAIEALKAALAQEQAEPVAWRITDGEGGWEYRTDLPEDWSIQWSARHGRKYEPLYTAPPQREPLTDEEIDRIRAAEREACAKECEEVDANPHIVLHHAVVCAAAIRARSKSC